MQHFFLIYSSHYQQLINKETLIKLSSNTWRYRWTDSRIKASSFRINQISQIKEKTERYWAIENMVTWPVDIGTRQQFRFNNILLFMPIIGDVAKRNFNWEKIYGVLKNLTTWLNMLISLRKYSMSCNFRVDTPARVILNSLSVLHQQRTQRPLTGTPWARVAW